jgi:prophage tail gpP-like protein
MSSVYATTGQKAVEDGTGMRESAEMQAKAQGSLKNIFKFLETVTEQPVKNQSELEARANYESVQREGTLIIAYVTVQGWLRDGKNLWRTGNDVWVYSPMAMLNMAMKIQTATFTQDSKSGTTTTLELVLPWRLADKPFGVATGPADTAPQPPPPATTSSDKPPVDPKPPPSPGTAEPPIDL